MRIVDDVTAEFDIADIWERVEIDEPKIARFIYAHLYLRDYAWPPGQLMRLDSEI